MADLNKIAKIKQSPPLRILDGIIVLLLIIAVVLPYVFLFKKNGGSVTVKIDGVQAAVYPLTTEETRYDISGHLTLHIGSGAAWVTDADCHDKVCQYNRISRVGEAIICAPNRIVITITGFSNDIYL